VRPRMLLAGIGLYLCSKDYGEGGNARQRAVGRPSSCAAAKTRTAIIRPAGAAPLADVVGTRCLPCAEPLALSRAVCAGPGLRLARLRAAVPPPPPRRPASATVSCAVHRCRAS